MNPREVIMSDDRLQDGIDRNQLLETVLLAGSEMDRISNPFGSAYRIAHLG
jgi:hypothetical protein